MRSYIGSGLKIGRFMALGFRFSTVTFLTLVISENESPVQAWKASKEHYNMFLNYFIYEEFIQGMVKIIHDIPKHSLKTIFIKQRFDTLPPCQNT